MLEILAFVQKYLPIEAFLPLFFLIIVLFYKYVYTPWNLKLNKMEDCLDDISNKIKNNDLTAMSKQLAGISDALEKISEKINQLHILKNSDLKKILDKLEIIEKKVINIVERLEKAKDEAKDNKIDFNQQLFTIKQEISELRSKIEPLLFIRHSIK